MPNKAHLAKLKDGIKNENFDIWNRWRQENPDIKPNLSGAELSGAELSWANLSWANLSWANLSEANLSQAYLGGANLNGADFYPADLLGAVISYTIFGNNDLGKAKGLDEIAHFGPSSIGIDTIYRSKGNIPGIFLRGAGVPESLIQYLPSLVGNPIEFYSCFISYSHEDKSFARRLYDGLQGRGIRCWLDEKHMLPGDDIYARVDRAIRIRDKVLLCCSKNSLDSWWVSNEIKTTLEKEQQLGKNRNEKILSLIPLNLDGYMFGDKWDSGYRAEIRSRLAADFAGWEQDNKKFEEQFERVIMALHRQRPAEI